MADIRLLDYGSEIAKLIRVGHHEEAIVHCQHILNSHPQHVRSQSLLGQAYLGHGMRHEAMQTFELVLAADPEEVAANLGMAAIFAQQGAMLEALQRLAIAYELAPGDIRVRDELQRLNAQRPDPGQGDLKLSRGALGTLYARSGLWERAIAVFRALLAEDERRYHTAVALGEALWRSGQRSEAVETCLHVTEALPLCLKANLVLGEVWLLSGHPAAGQERLNMARALDPENIVAQDLLGRYSPLPAESVVIPRLGFATDVEKPPALSGDAGSTILPDWLQELGDEDSMAPVDAMDTTPVEIDAGKAHTDPPARDRADAGEASLLLEGMAHDGLKTDSAAGPSAPGFLDDIPDWLRGLDSALDGEDLPSGFGTEQAPPRQATRFGDEPGASAPIPDWLSRLAPSRLHDASRAFGQMVTGDLLDDEIAEPEPSELPTEFPDDTPPWWLDEGVEDLEVAEAPNGQTVQEDERPDWVREMEAVAGVGFSAADEEPLPPGSSLPRTESDEPPPQLGIDHADPDLLLEKAHACQEKGDWTGALDHYAALVATSEAIPEAIERLKLLSDTEADQARVCELLGDAYRNEDLLDQALEMYQKARWVLDRRRIQES